ncbi:MAG: HEAT repeat domain-containing protein [Myxococcota bacterium]
MTAQDPRAGLRDADPERRRQAVGALPGLGVEDVVDPLYAALGDEDWRVRKEAVGVAEALSSRVDLVPKLIEALCDGENVGRRNAALEVLGRLGPIVARPLVDALPRVPSSARKFVIDALGDSNDRQVVPVLVEAAEGDADPNAAAAALDALARLGGPEAERALRRRLSSRDPFQRMAALDGLARLNATVPWEEIAPMLEDRLVRRVALALLGRTGRREAIDPLVDALADPSPHVVSIAAVALVQLHGGSEELAAAVAERARRLPMDPRRALRSLLVGGDLRSRQAAAHLLLLARDPEALEGIVVLASEDALSPAALGILREWGAGAVLPLLEVHRRSQGPARPTSLEVAADLGAEPLVRGAGPAPELQRVLRAAIRAATRDRDPLVVLAAARSMSWWAEAADAPLLVELAARGREDVARACGEALESLVTTAPDAVRDALDGVVFDGTAGAALAGVAARIGGPHAFERLQTALAADDPQSRKAAVSALAAIGDRRAAEHIGYALTDENVDVQTAAAEALGRMRDEQGQSIGVDSLLLALQSESDAVQAAAARALGQAGEERAIPPLRELVRSGSPGVAAAAMRALRRLHDPALGDLLVEALGHADGEVVKQALKAIRETEGDRASAHLAAGLSHAGWDVRALAARLLGEVGTDEAIAAVRERQRHETDPMVRQALQEALGEEENG